MSGPIVEDGEALIKAKSPIGVKGKDGNGIATTLNPVPVEIQGSITLTPEVEIKNDSGNPVPVSGTVVVTPSGTQDVNLTKVSGTTITLGEKASTASLPITLSTENLAALELIGIKGADGTTIAINTNPVPISDAGGIITIDGTITVGSSALPSGAATEQSIDRIPTGGELLVNANLFEDANADNIPDGWLSQASAGVYVPTERAWQATMAAAGYMLQQTALCSPMRRIFHAVRAKRTAGSGNIFCRLQWFNSSGTQVGPTVDGFAAVGSDYGTYTVEDLAPATAAYLTVSIRSSAASTWRLRRTTTLQLYGPREDQIPAALGAQEAPGSMAVVSASKSVRKKSVSINTSGDNTIIDPDPGKKVRLLAFGYSAGAGVSGVLVGMKLAGYEGGGVFDQQYLVAPGQPYFRNIEAGKRYVEGNIDALLIVNLGASQLIHVNVEWEET